MLVFPRMTKASTIMSSDRSSKNKLTQRRKERKKLRKIVWRSLRLGISRNSHAQARKKQAAHNNIANGTFRPARRLASSLLAIFLALVVTSSALAQSCQPYTSPHQRIGFNVAPDNGYDIADYDAARLGAGWYHNYGVRLSPYRPGGIRYHQMVRASIDRSNLDQVLASKIRNNPGSLWILGNEPDRYGQDGQTPAQYAAFYHDLYTYIRTIDPTSRIAVAGIVQPTPIRLRYLDMVLSSYAQQFGGPMPVEIWDIHNFILPEECGWGASIPPGLEGYRNEAVPCPATLDDHGDLNIFKAQIRTFRQWMKDRGYRNTPLIVSEYGILLSKYHGYDHPRVRDYMTGTFDFMLNATDAQLGYSADGNRLVQEFAWFSLNYWEFDINTYFGLNGNLFDHDSAQITPLGLDFAAYTQAKTLRTIDLTITDFQPSLTTVAVNTPVTFETTFSNQGGIAAENVTLQLWDGAPFTSGTVAATTAPIPQVLTGCDDIQRHQQQWTPTTPGLHTIYGVLAASNQQYEIDQDNNIVALAIQVVGATPTQTATPTPVTTAPTATPTLGATAPTATPTLVATAPTATPTATPAANVTPTAMPATEATATVDPQQTTTLTIMTSDGAKVRVTIPAGTVAEPITIVLRSLATLPGSGRTLHDGGHAFQIEAYRNNQPVDTLTLTTPILLTLTYAERDSSQIDEHNLMLYRYDTAAADWVRNGITLINHNTETNQLAVSYSDENRTPGAVRSFAIFAEATATPTATTTPTTIPNGPTATPTPPVPTGTNQLFLPLISNGTQ